MWVVAYMLGLFIGCILRCLGQALLFVTREVERTPGSRR